MAAPRTARLVGTVLRCYPAPGPLPLIIWGHGHDQPC
jgi:hypothetical protein